MQDDSPKDPHDPVPDSSVPIDDAGAAIPEDAKALLQELYQELRALAAHHLKGERKGHPLHPTALLHEAYLRLHHRFALGVKDRVHLMALISRTMRRVLVDHARMGNAIKRSADRVRVTFHEELRITDAGFEDVLDLHLVLERYRQVDARAAMIAEWQLFGGFTQAEVAQHLALSERTVREDYAVARAWLRRELTGESPTPGA